MNTESGSRQRRNRARGVTLIELAIATLVLSVGLIGLARLFVLATLNSALAVNMSQGLNDAQRLIEVYKTEAALTTATSSKIVSGTYSATNSSSAYHEAMSINGGATGYRSKDFRENIWVFDHNGNVISGTFPVSPSLPPGFSAGDLRAPSTIVPDKRYNQVVTLMSYVRSS
jgi:type II secretory pathway pseudopilin PulG